MNLGRRSFAALVVGTLCFGVWLSQVGSLPIAVTPVALPAFQDAPRGGDVALAVNPPARPGSTAGRALRFVAPPAVTAAPAVLAGNGLQSAEGSAWNERHRLQVQVLRVERGQARLSALASGEADVALVTLDDWVRAGSVGDVVALAGWSRGADGVRTREAGVPLEGLAGKKVGLLGDSAEWLWWALLSRRELPVETRRALERSARVQEDAAVAEAALASGALDALVGPLPAKADVPVVASSAEVPGALAEVLVSRPGLLAAEPGTVAEFVEGYWDGLLLLEADPSGALSQAGAALGLTAGEARLGLARVRLADFGDNALFFGLSGGEAPADRLAIGVREALERAGRAPRGPFVRPSAARGVVAGLAPAWRGMRPADAWVLRGKMRVADHPLVGQRVLLHFAPGGAGLLEGDRRLLDAVGEAMQRLQTPTLLLEAQGVLSPAQLPSLPDRRARWVVSELQRGFRLHTGRFSELGEAPPGALPDAEAVDVLSLSVQAR